METPDWSGLPSELLIKIAHSAAGTDGMRGVCRTWKAGLEELASKLSICGPDLPLNLPGRFGLLTSLNLYQCELVSVEGLEALGDIPLQSLALRLKQPDLVTPELIHALRNLGLARLDLELGEKVCSSSCDDEDAASRTSWSPPPVFDLDLLEGLPVRHLEVRDVDTREDALEPLRDMPLTSLVLSGNSEAPKTDILELLGGKALSILDLSRFEGGNFDDSQMAYLQDMVDLVDLRLGRDSYGLTTEGLEFLLGKRLTSLDLSLNEATEAWDDTIDLEVLRGMPLQFLSLVYRRSCNFSVLESMPLTRLYVPASNFDDSDLDFVVGKPITDLDLAGTEVTDAGLMRLRDMPLTKLDLMCCAEIEGRFLVALKDVPLKELVVGMNGDLSPELLLNFWQSKFPNKELPNLS